MFLTCEFHSLRKGIFRPKDIACKASCCLYTRGVVFVSFQIVCLSLFVVVLCKVRITLCTKWHYLTILELCLKLLIFLFAFLDHYSFHFCRRKKIHHIKTNQKTKRHCGLSSGVSLYQIRSCRTNQPVIKTSQLGVVYHLFMYRFLPCWVRSPPPPGFLYWLDRFRHRWCSFIFQKKSHSEKFQ